MRELLSNNSLFVGQLYKDKSLTLRARDLIFTTDLQTVNITQQFTAGADLFLKYNIIGVAPTTQFCICIRKIVNIQVKPFNVETRFYQPNGTALKGKNLLLQGANSFL